MIRTAPVIAVLVFGFILVALGGEILDYSHLMKSADDGIEVVEGKGGNYKFVEEDEVLILTRENFHYFVLSRANVLVQFYAPMECDECKRLAPEYSAAAKELKKENLILAKVDGTKETELAKEFMITGYPSIVLFHNGKKVDQYGGKLSSYDLIDYMKEKTNPDWTPPSSRILALTSSNYTRITSSTEIMLVGFFAHWCKHCQQLEPEFEAAARSLADYNIVLAKVDGPAEKELADSLKIAGWPSLWVVRKGKAIKYKGPREHRGIVDHMKELSKPPSKLVNSLAELKNGLDRKETTIIGFFSSNKSELFKEYLEAAQHFRGILTCLHTFDDQVADQFGSTKGSIVVYQPEIFHSKYEKPMVEYAKVTGNAEDIVQFVQFHSVPLVGQRTKINEEFKYGTRPLVAIYYDANFGHQYVKDTQITRQKVLEVAKIYLKTNVKFAICNEDEYAEELKAAGLFDATEDVKVVAYDKNLKFRMEPTDDLDPEEMKKFIAELVSGHGKAYFRSQPVPKVQSGPALQVVADNFNDQVLKVNKDVLILFHTPWCPVCRDLEPHYNRLAKAMKKENDNLVVAKMDASANDVHPIFGQLRGYPSIFFVPVGSKQDPVPYTSPELTYEALKTFAVKEASLFLTEEERMGLDPVTKDTSSDDEQPNKDEL